jgi:hypothetical protein
MAARSEFAAGCSLRRDEHCDLAEDGSSGRLLDTAGEQPETETACIQAGEIRHPRNEIARIGSEALVRAAHWNG